MTSFFSFDHHDISFKTTFGGFLTIGDPKTMGFKFQYPEPGGTLGAEPMLMDSTS